MARTSTTSRSLTAAERQLSRSVFGDAIALDGVRVHGHAWAFFQPRNVTMAPDGHLYFPSGSRNALADFGVADERAQAHFIHEMTHVWQHQRGLFLPLARLPFARYRYRLVPGRPFAAYGVEQQAEMVAHAFLLRAGAWANSSATLAELASLLPFEPWRRSASS